MNYILLLRNSLSSSIDFYLVRSPSGQDHQTSQCSLFCYCQSLNIVVEIILDEGDDVTNLYHDTYECYNDMLKIY